jgi:hypothetical protein
MEAVVPQIGVALIIVGAANYIGQKATGDADWYDFIHNYVAYSSEYTDTIDRLLMIPDHGLVKQIKRISDNQFIPDTGVHYYYPGKGDRRSWRRFYTHYMGLRKIETKMNDFFVYHYVSFSLPNQAGMETFEIFDNQIRGYILPGQVSVQNNIIKVISIDTSTHIPKTTTLNKLCKNAKNHQRHAMDLIMNRWNERNDFNSKIIISGKSGIGKTYSAMLVKKEIERRNPNTNVRLFDDFDPSSIGVNINELALKFANKNNPVILVVNEIDVAYNKVLHDQEPYDSRIQYTRNKQTFNNLMDTLGSMPYVMTILTTEKSPEDLYKQSDFHSFMRKGRIDYFLRMTGNSTALVENDKEQLFKNK